MLLLVAIAVVLLLVIGTVWVVHLATHPPSGSLGRALAHGLPTDPGEAGLQWHAWTCADMEVWTIEGDDATGPTVVLLHDWAQQPIDLLGDAEHLVTAARAVVIPTLRGHGPGSGRCTLGREEVHDVSAVLDTIEGPVALYGTGLGGLIALSCADRGEANVTSAWRDTADGLRHVLDQYGMPAFPLLWTGRICLS
ncbi:MAG: hypothetical protein MK074_04525 [Phycisphaerales bacterium]|nr:hypothetical protein [Phycisphaerales bacterium]